MSVVGTGFLRPRRVHALRTRATVTRAGLRRRVGGVCDSAFDAVRGAAESGLVPEPRGVGADGEGSGTSTRSGPRSGNPSVEGNCTFAASGTQQRNLVPRRPQVA